jgi:DMSO/TMAO reductase YedYZ molybdopterin-dependent catalytic subunit
MMLSRRTLLRQFSRAVLGAGVSRPLLSWATDTPALSVPGKEGMIVRSGRFLDLEMPPEFLETWLTPIGHFFVRNHMHEPSTLDADAWRLSIGGEVDRPYTLALEDLSKLKSHTVTNTLECAGNGRGFQQPRVPGAVATRCGWNCTVQRATPARSLATCGNQNNGQACNVSWS